MPTASTSPNSVSMLSEKPNICMTAQVPISDTGMAMTGMSVARHVLRNSSTTRTTSAGGLQDGHVQLADRDLDELGRIVGQAIFEPLREALGDLGHRILDALGGAHRVGAGLLIDDDDHGGIAVGVAAAPNS